MNGTYRTWTYNPRINSPNALSIELMFQIAETGFEPVISSLWDLRDAHFSTPHYMYIILHFDEIVKSFF